MLTILIIQWLFIAIQIVCLITMFVKDRKGTLTDEILMDLQRINLTCCAIVIILGVISIILK